MDRCCVRIAFLVLAACVGLGLSGPARAAQATGPAGAYTSPTYGYRVSWWEPWAVAEERSEGGRDVLELDNGTSLVRFTGGPYRGDAPTCVIAAAEKLRGGEGVRDMKLAEYMDPPVPRAGGDERAYWAVFTFATAAADGTIGQHFAYAGCRVLVPDEAVLLVTQLGPRDRMEDQLAASIGLLESLELPES